MNDLIKTPLPPAEVRSPAAAVRSFVEGHISQIWPRISAATDDAVARAQREIDEQMARASAQLEERATEIQAQQEAMQRQLEESLAVVRQTAAEHTRMFASFSDLDADVVPNPASRGGDDVVPEAEEPAPSAAPSADTDPNRVPYDEVRASAVFASDMRTMRITIALALDRIYLSRAINELLLESMPVSDDFAEIVEERALQISEDDGPIPVHSDNSDLRDLKQLVEHLAQRAAEAYAISVTLGEEIIDETGDYRFQTMEEVVAFGRQRLQEMEAQGLLEPTELYVLSGGERGDP